MKIALVNESRRVSPAEAQAIAAACDAQLRLHLCPAWGLAPSSVSYFDAARHVPGGFNIMTLRDVIDDPEALGYHTDSGAKVYALVGVQPVLNAGGATVLGKTPSQVTVCSVVSHEACEMVVDPYCNLWIDGPARPQGNQYSLEVCDPVESDSYVVTAGAVRGSVSNFVLPDWCDATPRPRAKFDYLNKLRSPFTMTDGGYMMLRRAAGQETAVYGRLYAAWRLAKKASAVSRSSRKKG